MRKLDITRLAVKMFKEFDDINIEVIKETALNLDLSDEETEFLEKEVNRIFNEFRIKKEAEVYTMAEIENQENKKEATDMTKPKGKSLKKVSKPPKQRIKVKMVTFTGMVVGEFLAIYDKERNAYRVDTKRRGSLYFDVTTLVEIKTKQQGFANKLEIIK